ncbi:MAG: peptide chain release factor family protein [Candidatus Hydrogenedens sp.]
MKRFGVSLKKEQELIQWMERLEIKEDDLEEQFISSRGPGGQNVNHTSTGVYIRHIPSSIEVKIDTSRSQSLNRFLARRRLCELLEYQRYGKESSLIKKINKAKKQKQRRNRRSKKKYLKTETPEITNSNH